MDAFDNNVRHFETNTHVPYDVELGFQKLILFSATHGIVFYVYLKERHVQAFSCTWSYIVRLQLSFIVKRFICG